jgi:hypothetical protein
VGLLIATVLGGAIGGIARRAWPAHTPRRLDVACILASVGAALGVLSGIITGAPWAGRLSPGSAGAAIAGAAAILVAFAALPRTAPTLTRALPGRPSS